MAEDGTPDQNQNRADQSELERRTLQVAFKAKRSLSPNLNSGAEIEEKLFGFEFTEHHIISGLQEEEFHKFASSAKTFCLVKLYTFWLMLEKERGYSCFYQVHI